MKKLSLILLTLVMAVGFASAQGADKQTKASKTTKAPKATFAKTVHDFGKVKEDDKTATTTFKFKNEGNAPLIIQRVQASCGCTTPDYTKEPILPGKEGTITVTYSTVGRVYAFDKSVTVFSNVPDEIYTLRIKGEVVKDIAKK